MGLDLKQRPPPPCLRKCANGWGVDKQLEDSNLAQTKQSHTHRALQICRGSPRLPSVQPRESTLHWATLPCRQTHICMPEKTLANVRGGGAVIPSAVDKHWPPSVGKTPHTLEPLPGAGGNSVTSQEARAVTAPCGKGEGAQRSPQPRSLYAPPPPRSPKPPASGALTFLGGGCMMLKGH